MDTKIQNLGVINGVKLFFDPLRKSDSFLLLKKNNEIKNGFIGKDNSSIVFESNVNTKWDDVTSIIAGFSDMNLFEKIKETIA